MVALVRIRCYALLRCGGHGCFTPTHVYGCYVTFPFAAFITRTFTLPFLWLYTVTPRCTFTPHCPRFHTVDLTHGTLACDGYVRSYADTGYTRSTVGCAHLTFTVVTIPGCYVCWLHVLTHTLRCYLAPFGLPAVPVLVTGCLLPVYVRMPRLLPFFSCCVTALHCVTTLFTTAFVVTLRSFHYLPRLCGLPARLVTRTFAVWIRCSTRLVTAHARLRCVRCVPGCTFTCYVFGCDAAPVGFTVYRLHTRADLVCVRYIYS